MSLLMTILYQHFIKYCSPFKKNQKSGKLHCSTVPSPQYNDEIVSSLNEICTHYYKKSYNKNYNKSYNKLVTTKCEGTLIIWI